jgi:hypothetical protein
MHWACWAGQVEDAVNFNVKWEGNVMTYELKVGVTQQVGHIAFAACEEVVNAEYIFTTFNQSIAKMGAEEASTAGD